MRIDLLWKSVLIDDLNTHKLSIFPRQNLLCDVTLVAGEDVEIPAHKMVLAACSPYFYAMFTSFEESKLERVTLQGVDSEALKLLVDYVYSAEIHVTEDNVQASVLASISRSFKNKD